MRNLLTTPVGATATGTTAMAYPVWIDWMGFLSSANEVLLSLAGLAIVGVTLWAKILEIKLKRRQLEELKKSPPS